MNMRENERVKIAFCPTMGVFMEELSDMDEIEQVPVPSAGQALFLLKSRAVDGTIIGRYAKRSELPEGSSFVKLRGGQTLIYRQKTGIPVEVLKDVQVITYLSPESVSHLSGFFKSVEHLESLEECLKYGLEIPVIIDWNDYRDDFELLIPVNRRGEKVLEFRAPVLYHTGIPEVIVSKIEEKIGRGQ